MNFYIVYYKSKRKFDKYIKINCIRNKVIVDINELLEENDKIEDMVDKEYFNLMVYTKIVHSLQKSKDIYYIPNPDDNIIISEILKLRQLLNFDIKFNALIFYEEFLDDTATMDDLFKNISNLDSCQIIKDY